MADTEKEMRMWTSYMISHGIPRHTIKDIRMAMLNDAVQQAKDFKYDRIYSCLALAAHHAFGYELDDVVKLLKEFDRISGSIDQDEHTWNDVMNELEEKVGIVIFTDEQNRLVLEHKMEEEK